jgi:hypothetical protein
LFINKAGKGRKILIIVLLLHILDKAYSCSFDTMYNDEAAAFAALKIVLKMNIVVSI